MKWGIQYSKDGQHAINARAENILDGAGMWNKFRAKNRCLVVAQGYYEWQTRGKAKLPHFIKYPNGALMLFAALYDSSVPKGETEPTYTVAIVTTHASRSLGWLHDRQPVILSDPAHITRWLDTSSNAWSADLAALLVPREGLTCYAVPQEVGKVGTESPTFIEPVAQRKDGIQAMFARQTAAKAFGSGGVKAESKDVKASGSKDVKASGSRGVRASGSVDVKPLQPKPIKDSPKKGPDTKPSPKKTESPDARSSTKHAKRERSASPALTMFTPHHDSASEAKRVKRDTDADE
ncbi:hypothetical protein BV22DRAFT_1038994 [Leucogyrophana mollusca]|uniref:Uncharacterized protein n=1 Tax=Leucogyrophana mollusca TaxID=85980 RepID=A0ACB8B6H0_9AGAM|nr:hypothetical protein BV22DRAFT_1038994 [Leucogyrophana mollusca]